jgi:hypothetical protein
MRFTALPLRLLAVACLLMFVAVVPTEAQKNRKITAEANEAGTLEQCRNGSTSPGEGCDEIGGNTGWVSGNAGFQNSHWAEDQFLPYRILFSNLSTQPNNTKTVIIGYDILQGSDIHAIDYLGTYNYTEKVNNPCVGVTGCNLATPSSTFPIPEDTVTVTNQINPNTSDPITQIPGEFTMWGGEILSVAYLPYAPGSVERRIRVTFHADVSNPVLAWGGHVAWQGDWGAGNSAGGISGSPYHMRFIELDGQGGNQDRSLSADAVIPSGALFIVKEVDTFDGTDSSTQAFPFTVSRDFASLSFDLVDDNDGPGVDTAMSSGITLFGPSNMITVTEGSVAGWQLLDITCVENKTQNSVTDVANKQVFVAVDLNEIVTCTFRNGQIGASAADGSVSGRVTNRFGAAIANARMKLTSLATGQSQTVYTNSFGYYGFKDLETGDAYTLSVSASGYTFTRSSTSFTLQGDLTVDFVAK